MNEFLTAFQNFLNTKKGTALIFGLILSLFTLLFLANYFESYFVYWIIGPLLIFFVVAINILPYLKLLDVQTEKKTIFIFCGIIVNYTLTAVLGIFFSFYGFQVILIKFQYNFAIVFSFLGLLLVLIFFALLSKRHLKATLKLSSNIAKKSGTIESSHI